MNINPPLVPELMLEHDVLQSILDAQIDPFVMLRAVRDDSGEIRDFELTEVNSSACHLFRSTRAELIGISFLLTQPGLQARGLFERLVATITTGKPLVIDDAEYFDVTTNTPRRWTIRATKVGDSLSATWRDVTNRTDVLSQFQLLAQNASDIVWHTDLDGTILWVSPSVKTALGWEPGDLLGTNARGLLLPEDRDDIDQMKDRLLRGEEVEEQTMRYLCADGSWRWMSKRLLARRNADGKITSLISSMRDRQQEIASRQALKVLSRVNSILVPRISDREITEEVCRFLVEESFYSYACYCRQGPHGLDLLAASGRRRVLLLDELSRTSSKELGESPVDGALTKNDVVVIDDTRRNVRYRRWLDTALPTTVGSLIVLPIFDGETVDGALTIVSQSINAFTEDNVAVFRELAVQIGVGLQRTREHRQLTTALGDQALLSTAIGQVAEAVIVTDPFSKIIYANPAAVSSSGYALEEIIGSTPKLFKSNLHDESFYRLLWEQLSAGRPWHGILVNKRRNGEIFEEETTISPVVDAEGSTMAYVAVKRDLSFERRLQRNLNREQQDTNDIVTLMRDVRSSDSFEGTAKVFCSAVTKLGSVDGAAVLLFDSEGGVVTVGTAGERVTGIHSGEVLPVSDPDLLYARTLEGPWWIDLSRASEEPESNLAQQARAHQYSAVAMAPIRWEGRLVGILAVTTKDADGATAIGERLAVFEELGSYAGTHFGAQADTSERRDAQRRSLRRTITQQRFFTVFQPVVLLRTREIVGYEALTRFNDGHSPGAMFEHASTIGLERELELACARSALEAAERLPPSCWLSLNFSPTTVVEDEVRDLLQSVNRNLAVEITEHRQIENYPALFNALDELRPCRVFVDDAGAGYAGLRHILEIHPDVVKLDIGLVRSIDADPARQALATGMRRFADLTGTELLAEGVETEEEAETLLSLGIDLAQGFLFGRPAVFPDFN